MKRIAGSSNLMILCLFVLLLSGCSKPKSQNEGQKTGERAKEKSSEAAGAVGGVLTDSIGMQFKLIPAGSFLMGSPDSENDRQPYEGPQHKVTLTKPFYLGIYEVTQEQYEKVMGSNLSNFKGPKLPVENVSWNDAQDFCRKLSQLEKNMTYRLPTEVEWEYACRAGTKTAYYWGDSFDDRYVWTKENNGFKTREVGTRQPNAWGLYDMSGNVWEWCEDWYGDYSAGEQVDPKGAASGSGRVDRGGGWYLDARGCRSAIRGSTEPDYHTNFLGFRVVAIPVAGDTPAQPTKPDPALVVPAVTPDPVAPASTPVPVLSAAGDRAELLTNSIGMKLKLIPTGSFPMGSPDTEEDHASDEGPLHKVTISKPFYIGVYEVTQEEWGKVMDNNPSIRQGTNLPVTDVFWNDIHEFIRRLSKKENINYRLPTEAEWEYACRAGTTTAYYWGDGFDEQYAWSTENSVGELHEVGLRKPNAWGLFDMSGNVSEFCNDFYEENYAGTLDQTDPKGPSSGKWRVCRGGSHDRLPKSVRSASRDSIEENVGMGDTGFRLVRD